MQKPSPVTLGSPTESMRPRRRIPCTVNILGGSDAPAGSPFRVREPEEHMAEAQTNRQYIRGVSGRRVWPDVPGRILNHPSLDENCAERAANLVRRCYIQWRVDMDTRVTLPHAKSHALTLASEAMH
ncbi:hypothetical protein J6590_008933 [Homalodisca vitripennis]|nr:hypothetical protein J6590_008933 [Homalodisca vitripennis]